MPIRSIDDDQNFDVDLTVRSGRDTEELHSLRGLMTVEQRRRFVKKLFHGDHAAYEAFVNQLEGVVNWGEAHRRIQEFFVAQEINPYQEDASRFSDLVYKRYFPLDDCI